MPIDIAPERSGPSLDSRTKVLRVGSALSPGSHKGRRRPAAVASAPQVYYGGPRIVREDDLGRSDGGDWLPLPRRARA
eukprot:2524173-Alexandrium_andersonii.AAC.1